MSQYHQNSNASASASHGNGTGDQAIINRLTAHLHEEIAFLRGRRARFGISYPASCVDCPVGTVCQHRLVHYEQVTVAGNKLSVSVRDLGSGVLGAVGENVVEQEVININYPECKICRISPIFERRGDFILNMDEWGEWTCDECKERPMIGGAARKDESPSSQSEDEGEWEDEEDDYETVNEADDEGSEWEEGDDEDSDFEYEYQDCNCPVCLEALRVPEIQPRSQVIAFERWDNSLSSSDRDIRPLHQMMRDTREYANERGRPLTRRFRAPTLEARMPTLWGMAIGRHIARPSGSTTRSPSSVQDSIEEEEIVEELLASVGEDEFAENSEGRGEDEEAAPQDASFVETSEDVPEWYYDTDPEENDETYREDTLAYEPSPQWTDSPLPSELEDYDAGQQSRDAKEPSRQWLDTSSESAGNAEPSNDNEGTKEPLPQWMDSSSESEDYEPDQEGADKSHRDAVPESSVDHQNSEWDEESDVDAPLPARFSSPFHLSDDKSDITSRPPSPSPPYRSPSPAASTTSNTYPHRNLMRLLLSSSNSLAEVIISLHNTTIALQSEIQTLKSEATERHNDAMKGEKQESETIMALREEVKSMRLVNTQNIQIARMREQIDELQRKEWASRESSVWEEIDDLVANGDEEFVDALEVEEDDVRTAEEDVEGVDENETTVIVVSEEILKLIAWLWRGRFKIGMLWLMKAFAYFKLYWWSLCLFAYFTPEF